MNNTSEFKRFLYFLITHQVNMDVMYHDLPMKILPSKYNDDVDYVTEGLFHMHSAPLFLQSKIK